MNNNQFDIIESQRQNGISLDEEGIHLTNVALIDHKTKETEDICRQSRTRMFVPKDDHTQQIKQLPSWEQNQALSSTHCR